MRRLADGLVLSLKDQIRTLRYSLRSEAEAPGSSLPQAYRNVDLGPLGAVGAMIGTPVLRMADGLFSQVETVTLGILEGPPGRTVFPRPITDYFGHTEDRASFTRDIYTETKTLLGLAGARHTLVSEHTIEALRNELSTRHRDLLWSAALRKRPGAGRDQNPAAVRMCAAISAGFARTRPIQKADLIDAGGAARHLMLAPNLYCGLVFGLSIAIASVRADAHELDGADLVESADAVVNARFDRLKVAIDGKDAVETLAREFETVLPFLP